MYTLSACLIAKNEENLIANCLESIKDIVQEIIVVDTGSTDRTLEIARSYGAKVTQIEWENDFSKARNLSLELATQDWILVLDCDETLSKEDGKKLKNLFSQQIPYEGFHIHLNNYIGGRTISSVLVLRLFKNRKAFRFKGKIHEQVGPTIVALYGIESVPYIDLAINHYGYDPTYSSQSLKSDRNLNLLLQYTPEQKDGYYYYVLGNEYVRISDYAEAIHCYLSSLDLCKKAHEKPVYLSYTVMHLGLVYYELKYYSKLIALCTDYEPLLPNFKDLYLLKSLGYKDMGQYAHSLDYLKRYKVCPTTECSYPSNQLSYVDSDELLNILEANQVQPTLYTAFLVSQNTPSLLESIRNMSGISYKIFAFLPIDQAAELNDLAHQMTYLGVTILWADSLQNTNLFTELYEEVKNSWLVILNDNEILPYPVVKQMEGFLDQPLYTHYTFNLYNLATATSTTGLRLIHVLSCDTLINVPPEVGSSYITLYQNYVPS
ncbi:MAG: glycosyltransferase family 2 protein [Niameybacter sp.]|uniref:glycosyltransferase family 2 protein n=1 Tax=Niameybacter sp. TaxID=2033640 RepID=UPI002FC80F7C